MENYSNGCLRSITSRGKKIELDFKILPDTNFTNGYFTRFWSFNTNRILQKTKLFRKLTSLAEL